MTDTPSTEAVRELFSATSALITAIKEQDEPTDLQPYIESVEDALQGIEDETGWDAEVRAIVERQIAGGS
jgi:hypothetical protein